MSSHHFVKEYQEPALLLLDAIEKDVVDPLLEWSPTVVISSQTLDQVLSWGIKVDVVIGAGTDVKVLTERLSDYGPVKILASGEGNLVETALYFLISSRQSAVNIVVTDPKSMIELVESFTDRLDISLVTSERRWSFIRTGIFKKWLPAGSRIDVLGGGAFSSSNLERMENGFSVQHDGVTNLASDAGFWVAEWL